VIDSATMASNTYIHPHCGTSIMDLTNEPAITCGAVALVCVDCGRPAGCERHALLCPNCARPVCGYHEHLCNDRHAI
jgi:hypothetical protein